MLKKISSDTDRDGGTSVKNTIIMTGKLCQASRAYRHLPTLPRATNCTYALVIVPNNQAPIPSLEGQT